MIIWLDDLFFSGKNRDIDLMSLLRAAAERRHTLIISSDPTSSYKDRIRPNFDNWREKLLLPQKYEIDLLIEKLSYVSANLITRGYAKRILVTDRSDVKLRNSISVNLNSAIRAAGLPLYILIENQINDSAFIRNSMPKIWSNKLRKWEQNGELRFIQGGGNTEMARILEYHLNDTNSRNAFGLPAEVWQQIHFLIYDHDGNSKELPGEGAKKLDSLCKKFSMETRSHRLERRTQENYLPKSVLLKIVNERITNSTDKATILLEIEKHFQSSNRHFKPLPKIGKNPVFKNEYSLLTEKISDLTLKTDGSDIEMNHLAELIASAI